MVPEMSRAPTATELIAMHAPDGLFSLPVSIGLLLVVAAVLAVSCRPPPTDTTKTPARIADPARLGLLAAFIFAAQMVNFPVAGGTTGHLLGGTLAAILVGPAHATVIMTAVIFFQALLGDGGLTALGPNLFNMGLVGCWAGYAIFRAITGRVNSPRRVVAASFFAAWAAVPLAAACVSLELAASQAASFSIVFPIMTWVHMAIGIGEAVITASVIAFIIRTRPDLLYSLRLGTNAPPRLGRRPLLVAAAFVLVTASGLSLLPLFWDYPDGLESVGQAHGFIAEAPIRDDAGRLITLPLYELGVRLERGPTSPQVKHRYSNATPLLAVDDAIVAINGVATPDLESVAAQLHLDPPTHTAPLLAAADGMLRLDVFRAGALCSLSLAPTGHEPAGGRPPILALLPDYQLPGLSGPLSTSLAGALGSVVMFCLSFLVARVLLPASSGTEHTFNPTASSAGED